MKDERVTTHTGKWNPLDFDCRHYCTYCPENGKYSHEAALREGWRMIPRLEYAIWVSEDTDLFHDAVPSELISKVLKRAREVRKGYIFCTKNPARFKEFVDEYPPWAYLSTTIESDIDYKNSQAPPPLQRFKDAMGLKSMHKNSYFSQIEICVCIQPVMEFTPRFLDLLVELAPNQISIGPEKCGYDTPQPSLQAVTELAIALQNRIPNVEVNVHGRGVKLHDNPGDIIRPETWAGARTEYLEEEH